MPRRAGPKETYAETYRKPGLKIASVFLPACPHITDPAMRVDEMFILRAGKLDDGREFQDLRIYIKET